MPRCGVRGREMVSAHAPSSRSRIPSKAHCAAPLFCVDRIHYRHERVTVLSRWWREKVVGHSYPLLELREHYARLGILMPFAVEIHQTRQSRLQQIPRVVGGEGQGNDPAGAVLRARSEWAGAGKDLDAVSKAAL